MGAATGVLRLVELAERGEETPERVAVLVSRWLLPLEGRRLLLWARVGLETREEMGPMARPMLVETAATMAAAAAAAVNMAAAVVVETMMARAAAQVAPVSDLP